MPNKHRELRAEHVFLQNMFFTKVSFRHFSIGLHVLGTCVFSFDSAQHFKLSLQVYSPTQPTPKGILGIQEVQPSLNTINSF